METDSKERKAIAKIEKIIRDLLDTLDDRAKDPEIERLILELNMESEALDRAVMEDQLASDFIVLFSTKKMDIDQIKKIITSFSSNTLTKKFNAFLSMELSFSLQEYSKAENTFLDTFPDMRSSGAPLRLLLANAALIEDKKFLGITFSLNNIYDHDTITKFLKSKSDYETVSIIVSNFKKNSNPKAAIEVLRAASGSTEEPRLNIDLGELLLSTGEKDQIPAAINDIDSSDLRDPETLSRLINLYIEAGDQKRALRAANNASYMYPNDPKIIIQHSKVLEMMGRNDDALELLEKSLQALKSTMLIDAKADLLYTMGKHDDFVKFVSESYTDGIPAGMKMRYLDSLISLSDFDRALQVINATLSKNTFDIEMLKKKFNVQLMLNDTGGAYDTAEKVLKSGSRDRDCATYLLDQLFRRQDYETFLQKIDEIGDLGDKHLKNLVAASYLYEAEQEKAVTYIEGDPSVLSDPDLLDAAFFTIRDDNFVERILNAARSNSMRTALLPLHKILGKQIQLNDEIWDDINKTRSESVAWSAATAVINLKSGTKPEMIQALLSRQYFANINNLIDAVLLIYSGRFTEEMTDSKKFMYPLSRALIDIGDLKNAEMKLEQSRDAKKTDPFYHFLASKIQLAEGDVAPANKSIFRALGRLTNKEFLIQAIDVAIRLEDSDTILSMIDKIIRINESDTSDFSDLYRYLSRPEMHEFAEKIIARMDAAESKNIWIERLRRDRLIMANDLAEAEKVSRKIVVSRSKTLEDIKKHANLLQSAMKESERIEFLKSEEKNASDPEIDAWLGDYYFVRKEFDKALESYRKAESKGMKETEIKNLPETLIELGEFEDAENLLKKEPENVIPLIKLYHRTGRIQDIVELLNNVTVKNKEEESALLYISRILWVNRQIRDTLVQMFHDSGSLFLGKIISQRMMESRDFIGAERVMREILKRYPDDLENVRNLSDLLVETSHPTDAVLILTKTFKKLDDKGANQEIADRICRIYYETGEYRSIIDFYRKNPGIADSTNIQWIIRSFIEGGDFDTADRIAGQYHGSLLKEDSFREIIDEINLKKEFLDVLEYTARILKAEYKAGRILTSEEMVYTAGVPVDMVERVIHLLGNDSYFRETDVHLYEIVSRDVIQRAVRKSTVETIRDMKIFVIYNNMPKRDVMLSKNIYTYIKKCVNSKREPMLNDPTANALLRNAIKLGLKPEPLDVAYNLNLGISDAMDIISLMEYVAKLNS